MIATLSADTSKNGIFTVTVNSRLLTYSRILLIAFSEPLQYFRDTQKAEIIYVNAYIERMVIFQTRHLLG